MRFQLNLTITSREKRLRILKVYSNNPAYVITVYKPCYCRDWFQIRTEINVWCEAVLLTGVSRVIENGGWFYLVKDGDNQIVLATGLEPGISQLQS